MTIAAIKAASWLKVPGTDKIMTHDSAVTVRLLEEQHVSAHTEPTGQGPAVAVEGRENLRKLVAVGVRFQGSGEYIEAGRGLGV